MFRRKAIYGAILASTAIGHAHAQLEEVIVTATKRAESTQDIPISVQAVTGDSLRSQGILTFDEYTNFLPNVVDAGTGPGNREVYMRGAATEQSAVTVALANGSAPAVAMYLDETPVSLGSRNLDIYATDLARIETLSGPQGTLFGASSQAGTIRMITNKPVMNETEGRIDFGYGAISGGGESNNIEGMINLPIGDTVALRVAAYSNSRGGWIDNVAQDFAPNPTVVDRNSIGFGPYFRDFPLTTTQSISNDDVVEDDWNEATYTGFRAGLQWDINEDWSALVQHSSQDLDVDGSFLVDPSLGDDKSANFVPEYNRDEFELTTLTIEGRIAGLDVVYAGGYLDREFDALIDYTGYNNGGGYITYYLCSGNIYAADTSSEVNNCFDPTKQYRDTSSSERTTHELRVTAEITDRIRVLGGVYFSDTETKTLGEFQYLGVADAFSEFQVNYYGDNAQPPYQLANAPIPGVAGQNANGPRGPDTVFFNDFTRSEEELAFFGQIAFDVTDSVTATFSARQYDLETQLEGGSNFSFGCRYAGNGEGGVGEGFCNSHRFSNSVTDRFLALGGLKSGSLSDEEFLALKNYPGATADYGSGANEMFRGGGSNAATLEAIRDGRLDISTINSSGATEEDDVIIRASLDWQVTDDILLYGVYSEGYRPATQNRNAGQLSTNQSGVYEGYVVPAVAVTDELENMEIGVKSDLLDGNLRLNAVLFKTEITDLQVSRFDPSNVAFLVFMENVGDAETMGLDMDLTWLATNNLTLSGSMSFLDTELTRVNPQLEGISVPVGSELPLSPSFSGNLRARYDFFLADGNAWVTAAMVYRGESVSGLVGNAEFLEDTQQLAYGRPSGIDIQSEGGTFGTVPVSSGELPSNSRYVNEDVFFANLSAGYGKDEWTAEAYINNITDEEGMIAQTPGKFTPVSSTLQPRTVGFRLSYMF